MIDEIIKCDVLVIGCGGAGIRAAIEAADCGADVIIINKKQAGYTGSTFYTMSMPWGMMTAGDRGNDQDGFLEDILKASCGCLDKRLTEILVRESYGRFLELLNYGLKFRLLSDSNEKPCFGSRPRGAQLISISNARGCLLAQSKQRNIKIIENAYVFDILVTENRCIGALIIDDEGDIRTIYSKAAVMATGGAEHLWEHNLVTPDVAGDGYAMAANHGARLVNMEFIQFIPGTVGPIRKINFHHPTLASTPVLLNSKGEEYLHKYLPERVTIEQCLTERCGHGPFSCEDNSKYFDIAICNEESENKDGDVYGAQVIYDDSYYNSERNSLWREFLLSKGIDIKKTQLRIYPHCQGFNGGIVIDENCRTDIENLYACGECAGGPHGANRIGGNAILATQVFGKIAGEQSAKKAKALKYMDCSYDIVSYLKERFDSGVASSITPDDVMDNIKSVMQQYACIIREEDKLKEGIQSIEKMQKHYNCCEFIKDNRESKKAVNAYNSMITARLILNAMLQRRESRGSHYRKDFPNKSGEQFGSANFYKIDNNGGINLVNK